MKNQTQIEERLRRLVRKALDEHMASFDEKLPHKCHHNHRQPLDHRKTVYGEVNPSYNHITAGQDERGVALPVVQTLGLCMLNAETPDEWRGDICEDPVDAQRCSVYSPILTKEALYSEFVSNASSGEWLEKHYPEVWSLLWVLGDSLDLQGEVPPPPPLGLWSRVWQAIFPKTPVAALPPPEGEGASFTVYVPPLEAYEDHRPGTPVDHREAPAASG
jgi:hypothetical protein